MKATGTIRTLEIGGYSIYKARVDGLNVAANEVSMAFSAYGNIIFHDVNLAMKAFSRAVKIIQNRDHNRDALSGMGRIS